MKLTWEQVNYWKNAADNMPGGPSPGAKALSAVCEDWLEMYALVQDKLQGAKLIRCGHRMDEGCDCAELDPEAFA